MNFYEKNFLTFQKLSQGILFMLSAVALQALAYYHSLLLAVAKASLETQTNSFCSKKNQSICLKDEKLN